MRLALFLTVAGLALLLSASAASAATLTATGALGRDEITVSSFGSSTQATTVFTGVGAVAVTGGDAKNGCTPETDPLTGRTREVHCNTDRPFDLNVDMRAADDTLVVDIDDQVPANLVTLAGGAGNDTLSVGGPGTHTLRGLDGDDVLSSAGEANRPATFDGGVGRDLVDFKEGRAPPGSVRGGVTASLVSGTSTELYGRSPSGDTTRQGSLIAIERLSGTGFGDVLTGAAGADELIGEGGPDNLVGGDGNDTLSGGPGVDDVNGGNGTDGLDGGTGDDLLRTSLGGDSILMRDGFAERFSCANREIVTNDLVDSVDNAVGCASVSTAAAKHRFDTVLQRRRLRIGPRRRVGVRLACPARKPDDCGGTLRLRRGGPGGRSLAARRYRLEPGKSSLLRLRLTAAEAASVRGRAATLDAAEVDGDGRDRRVLRRTAVR